MSSDFVNLQATLVPKPEYVDEALREMLAMVRASRQEEGCLVYDLLRDEQDGRVRFHVQERYRDDAAVQAHRESAHYLAYRAKAGEWFAVPTQVVRLSDVDVMAKDGAEK